MPRLLQQPGVAWSPFEGGWQIACYNHDVCYGSQKGRLLLRRRLLARTWCAPVRSMWVIELRHGSRASRCRPRGTPVCGSSAPATTNRVRRAYEPRGQLGSSGLGCDTFAIVLAGRCASSAPGARAAAPSTTLVCSVTSPRSMRTSASYRTLLRRLEALVSGEAARQCRPRRRETLRGSPIGSRASPRGGKHMQAPNGLKVTTSRDGPSVRAACASAAGSMPQPSSRGMPMRFSRARPKVEATLRSAAYLQQRWAAALQGALIRAGIPVPVWLDGHGHTKSVKTGGIAPVDRVS